MVVAAMQGANQHTRVILGFSSLSKDALTCGPGESNKQPSDSKKLARPLSHSRFSKPGAYGNQDSLKQTSLFYMDNSIFTNAN